MPLPNEMWRAAFGRWMSKSSGSAKTSGWRLAAAKLSRIRVPAGRSWPASVVSRVVTRRHEIWLDWKRRTSSTALGISDGSAHELGPRVAARQQAREAVADQVGHRLVAGERQAVDDRLDLVVGDVVGMGVVGVEQLGGEVVGPVVALVGRELAAVAPVAEHPLGDLDLLGAGGVAPRERLAVTAPVLEQVVVLLGEPDEPEHRLAGQWVRQRGDELGRCTAVEHGRRSTRWRAGR